LVVGALLVGLAGVVVGCSDDGEPSVEAIAEAEELALAALLTGADLPAGDWVVEEMDLLEVDSYTPDPADWPEVCGEEPDWPSWDEDGVLVARGRGFMLGESSEAAFSTMVMVFESVEELDRLMERRAEEADRQVTDECTEALEARDTTQGFDSRDEEPLYELPDATGIRRISIFTTSGLTTEVTMEIHSFARGRVMAMYSIVGSDESPREIDHQGLLEAFEARVVAVQE
jgi:hypothetical protein